MSGDGIQEVVHVDVFDVESAQKSVDGGRNNGWPRGRIQFTLMQALGTSPCNKYRGLGRPRMILLPLEQL